MSETGSGETLRERYGVPADVALHRDAGVVLAWLPPFEAQVRRVAADPATMPASEVGGRAALARLPSDEGPLLVRTYRKGGWLRLVRGSRFHGRLRPLDELVLHRRLLERRVPVIDAVGAVVLHSVRGWRGYLLTKELEGAVDLQAWLYGVPSSNGLSYAETLRTAGRAVRALHDAGVSHADLHPKNLLVGPGGQVFVIDLDRAKAGDAGLDDGQRLANLVRLGRSVEKHRLKGLTAGRRAALRFLEGYGGNRAAAAEWLERIRGRLRRGLGARRLWWRLTGEARPWSGPRQQPSTMRETGS